MVQVTLVFADGDRSTVEIGAGETILAGARRQGIVLASDCEIGDCQTCRGEIVSGRIAYDEFGSLSLDDDEIAAGAVLSCVAIAQEDVVLRLPYTRASLLPEKTHLMRVTAVELLSASTVALRGRLAGLGRLLFHPGQYVNLAVPGTGQHRSYSMANAPEEEGELEFLIRLIEGGLMSRYLVERAAPGDEIELRGPRGVFYLRESERPIAMVAGGTGIAPMAAMLRSMIRRGRTARPVTLCFGVTAQADLFYTEELRRLGERFARFELRVAVHRPDAAWTGARGLVTELLEETDASGEVEAYLCGPPPMIDAARAWFAARGVAAGSIYAEEFVSTGGA